MSAAEGPRSRHEVESESEVRTKYSFTAATSPSQCISSSSPSHVQDEGVSSQAEYEMRDRPLASGVQALVANRLELPWSRAELCATTFGTSVTSTRQETSRCAEPGIIGDENSTERCRMSRHVALLAAAGLRERSGPDVHARFWESAGVRFPPRHSTHPATASARAAAPPRPPPTTVNHLVWNAIGHMKSSGL